MAARPISSLPKSRRPSPARSSRLDAQKVTYTTVDAEKHPEYAIRLGITSVPVLFANGKRYNGLEPALGWLDARKDP